MKTIDNLLDTLRSAHCDNATQAYYAKRHDRGQHSTMPATSFVYEFFLYNSLYQYDWQGSCEAEDLFVWSRGKMYESDQQDGLEKFVWDRCQANPTIIKRAFYPVSQLEGLDGEWTRITPGARITADKGQRFFAKLAELRDRVRSDDELAPSRDVFDLINECRYFVYLVRNNIFHGSKSIGEIYDRDQEHRLEVYDTFLKSLVSLFFLAVNKEPVAADYVQLPIQIPMSDGSIISVCQSRVIDSVASGKLKPEDSRPIRFFVDQQSSIPAPPNNRASLFYPSAGNDLIAPVLLGLPYCTRFFFYDSSGQRRRHCKRASAIQGQFKRLLRVQMANEGSEDESVLTFEIAGVPRVIHIRQRDNLDFLDCDVDLAFYFHRGDSPGNGGSGQQWDKHHIVDLGKMTPKTNVCQMLTDGEPGGLHPDLCARMQTIHVPISHRERDYYYGVICGDSLRQLKKP